jgi:hypothetical protein
MKATSNEAAFINFSFCYKINIMAEIRITSELGFAFFLLFVFELLLEVSQAGHFAQR